MITLFLPFFRLHPRGGATRAAHLFPHRPIPSCAFAQHSFTHNPLLHPANCATSLSIKPCTKPQGSQPRLTALTTSITLCSIMSNSYIHRKHDFCHQSSPTFLYDCFGCGS